MSPIARFLAARQLKLLANSEKPTQRLDPSRCVGFSLLGAGFNPAVNIRHTLKGPTHKRRLREVQFSATMAALPSVADVRHTHDVQSSLGAIKPAAVAYDNCGQAVHTITS